MKCSWRSENSIGSLELEFQMVVNHSVGTRNQTQVFAGAASALTVSNLPANGSFPLLFLFPSFYLIRSLFATFNCFLLQFPSGCFKKKTTLGEFSWLFYQYFSIISYHICSVNFLILIFQELFLFIPQSFLPSENLCLVHELVFVPQRPCCRLGFLVVDFLWSGRLLTFCLIKLPDFLSQSLAIWPWLALISLSNPGRPQRHVLFGALGVFFRCLVTLCCSHYTTNWEKS